MATGAVLGGIGAGVNAIQGITSSQQSKQAGQAAANRANKQQDMMNQAIFGMGADGQRSEDGGLLGSMQGGIERGVGGLTDMAAGNSASLRGFGDQLASGYNPYQDGSSYQFSDINTGQSFDFQPGNALMDQTMAAFDSEAAGARASALDNMARQSSANMGGLDALLAGRGVSRGSGVASGALSGLAGSQAAEMAGLERDLGAMGTQAALQGAQFDVDRLLQGQQIGSNYNLGERQFLGNMGLGQQELRSNYNMQERGLGADIYRSNEQLRQGALSGAADMYNTGAQGQIQAGLGSANAYASMLGPMLSMFLGNQDMASQQISAAGAGSANPMGNSFMDLAKLLQGGM